MEMKYLKEQDTGKRYLPVVHVKGIVGLDTSVDGSINRYTKTLTDTASGISNGTIEVFEFNKFVCANLELSFSQNSTLVEKLVNGTTVSIDIGSFVPFTFTPLVFENVCFEYINTADIFNSYKIDASVKLVGTTLSIIASLKENLYTVDNVGLVVNNPVVLRLAKIIGSATGILLKRNTEV